MCMHKGSLCHKHGEMDLVQQGRIWKRMCALGQALGFLGVCLTDCGQGRAGPASWVLASWGSVTDSDWEGR